MDDVREISNYWEEVSRKGNIAAFETGMQGPLLRGILHEMPGGQFHQLKRKPRQMGLDDRWPEVCQKPMPNVKPDGWRYRQRSPRSKVGGAIWR